MNSVLSDITVLSHKSAKSFSQVFQKFGMIEVGIFTLVSQSDSLNVTVVKCFFKVPQIIGD